MAAAAILGTLAGLGNLGEQRAIGSRIADEELIRRLAEQRQEAQFKTQQQQAQAQQQQAQENLRDSATRRQELQQRIQIQKQLTPIGAAFVANGKQYQRFQNPMTGEMTLQESQGPIPDSPEKQMYDALIALNFTPEEAKQEVSLKYGGKPSTATGPRAITPDPNNPGMGLITYYDPVTHQPYLQIPTMLPASFYPTVSQSSGTDIYGDPRSSTTTRAKAIPGQTPRFQAPAIPFNGSPGAPGTTPAGVPQAQAEAGALGTIDGRQVAPLDAEGNVPPQRGLNENVRALVNDIRKNPSAVIPGPARAQVDKWARAYNPQFSPATKLPAASITMIEKIDPVLMQIQRLRKDIESLNLTKNNTPFYLASSRAKYSLGIASPEHTLGADIAGLSLGSLVEAASALAGASRAMPALTKAMEHTPNPWVDSPKLIYDKLGEVQQRLQDIDKVARDPSTFMSSPGAAGAPANSGTPPPGATVRDFTQVGP